jgi:pyruvate-ferredoxin/flavodoxin oxidoreductase
MRDAGESPFVLDSPRATLKFRDYAMNEIRYKSLAASRPEDSARLMGQAQAAIDEKYQLYEEMAAWAPTRFHPASA